jgi:uncharacterized protein YbgA (DUF1722 family)/uncharacterized protein YbbK (DUF523 family)
VRPRVAISECLLGREVRYDGGHKRDSFLTEALSPHVAWVPVCPEVEAGMGVPREAVRLVGPREAPRMIASRSGADWTERMEAWAAKRTGELAGMSLDGYVLKKGSPSCGLERVALHRDGAQGASPTGTGLFAAALRRGLPALPLSEEGWLRDERRRESFLHRIFTHARLRAELPAGPAALIEQQAAHKLLFMAHSPIGQRRLGRLVALAGSEPYPALAERYTTEAMAVLAVPASRGKHVNVLQHILGYFRDAMPAAERRELLALIDEYRRGIHPLAVPLTLLVHHLHRHDPSAWLAAQLYFEPYPRAIAPR